MKKRIKKNSKMKRVARWHSVFFLISFGLYVALSAILTPSFMLSDMQTKSKALANETITLVAKVLDSPVVPIVSGSADCIGDNPVVSLTWPTDENSQTFDIARNGATLVTGLLDSSYEDSALPENRTYNTFVVTAHGPMGPGLAVSSPVSITNPAGCSGQFSPTQKILTLETTPIETFTDTPQITSQKPSFSGQTNIPYAKILITLHSGPTITATTYANVNGYWSWICPETLDFGSHTIYTTATDPNDPAITATDTFSFEIIQASSTQENSATHKKRSTTKKTSTPSTPAPTPNQSPATSASAPFS